MTKVADVRAKSADELQAMLLDLRKEQFNLRFQRATGQLESTNRIKAVRRDIARVKTIQTERARWFRTAQRYSRRGHALERTCGGDACGHESEDRALLF